MFTVAQLKNRLRAAGLPVSGKKSELVERLSATANPAHTDAPDELFTRTELGGHVVTNQAGRVISLVGEFRDQQENLIDTVRPALPTKRGNPVGSPMRRAQDAVRQGNVSYALSTAMAAIALAGPACSVFECNQLLRVLGDSGHVDAMMAIFDAMVAAGAMPTQVTYGTLISRAGACPHGAGFGFRV